MRRRKVLHGQRALPATKTAHQPLEREPAPGPARERDTTVCPGCWERPRLPGLRLCKSCAARIVGEVLPPAGEELPPPPIGGYRLLPDGKGGLRGAQCTGFKFKGARRVRTWKWV